MPAGYSADEAISDTADEGSFQVPSFGYHWLQVEKEGQGGFRPQRGFKRRIFRTGVSGVPTLQTSSVAVNQIHHAVRWQAPLPPR